MRMPPGYRFVPTDYELLKHHLLNKITNKQNLIAEINDVEVYNNDPQILSEAYPKLEDKWYFFSPRDRKYPKGSRPSRSAGNGYWKATGGDEKVYGEGEGLVGHKRNLVYYIGTYQKGVKTDWIMHEYWIDQTPRTRTHANDMKLDDWVLCRIYKKAPSKLKRVHDQQQKSKVVAPITRRDLEQESTSREKEQASTSSTSIVAREREEEETSEYLRTLLRDWDSISNDLNSLFQDNFVPSLNNCLSKDI